MTLSALVQMRGLCKWFPLPGGGVLRAVDHVDLVLRESDTFGLVGESGCGKSTLARLMIRLIEPSRGTILFRGEDIIGLSGRDLRAFRRRVQIVFQNPHSALDPRRSVFASIAEPLIVHGWSRKAMRRRVAELLAAVALPEGFLWRFPHELSGGQKQRVCIARALALSPELVILDEPTSALDVSVQAQILDLLEGLRERYRLSWLFISHNLAVVRQTCARVAVMYRGRIVEQGETTRVFGSPRHPYTRVLIGSVLPPRVSTLPEPGLQDDVLPSREIASGCRFAGRCPLATDRCRDTEPELAGDDHHSVACWQAQ